MKKFNYLLSNPVKQPGLAPALLLCMTFLLAGPAQASDDLVETWYMQPSLHLDKQDSTQKFVNSQSLNIGRSLHKRLDLEINLLSENTERRTESKGILLDGRYYLKPKGDFMPYIAGGISRVKVNGLDTEYQEPSTNIGLGFEHTLNHNGTRILADFRYFMDDHRKLSNTDEEVNDWSLRLGISIPLTTDLFK